MGARRTPQSLRVELAERGLFETAACLRSVAPKKASTAHYEADALFYEAGLARVDTHPGLTNASCGRGATVLAPRH